MAPGTPIPLPKRPTTSTMGRTVIAPSTVSATVFSKRARNRQPGASGTFARAGWESVGAWTAIMVSPRWFDMRPEVS